VVRDWDGLVEQGGEAAVDGGGGFAGELLIDDGAGDGFEVGAFGSESEAAGADALDDGGQFGVGALQVGDGAAEGEGRR